MMLDDVDRKLIEALMNNSRASMRQLAVELDVALGTIGNRLKRLEQEKIIKGYNVILDPAKVGWEMTVIVGLRITKGRMIEVQKRIAEDPRVFLVYDVTGDYDSFVVAKVQDTDDLNDLTKGVLTSEGIERSLTHVVLNTVKETSIKLPKTKS
ncbi:MAG: AsnC family transcriptional regulator [Euryarchaeota archaeon]|nr:AsnC family transcriptional regulator [Euryarchaeota archaeon]|tara:strand:+ start:1574 stop:2032 length:459 start_codon:yes stop_codon:yes gene_type:complete